MRASVKKWMILRRTVQILILLLFLSPLFLVKVEGDNFFYGSLASSQIFGIQLSDPLGALQVTLAAKELHWGYLGSALLILTAYLLLSGRVFCSWVCPVNTLLETTDLLRKKLKLPDKRFARNTKVYVMLAVLGLSFAIGVPVFEIISPIGSVMRNLLFLWGIGLFFLTAIVLFDLLVSKRGWCRYFCPVGGFYQLIGRFGLFRVRIDHDKCVHCQQCKKVCFAEPSILEPAITGKESFVSAGDCSLCGACVDVCSHQALTLGLRPYNQPAQAGKSMTTNP
ncbi:quinol dehydrogenase ferredoxin subunit NapH [Effusibacillus lacus]|uniref:quinol dehydrogenase ferredoxin subunit NapH n=1 Tax=Effusibacillus lacus TaxID=1348429 RepID=UPI000BB86287|nr:quinol dehydrogenase ferredoxin subunit NapH [Effusibacillus lacus]TCS75363.1 ferredoxin-type protein NapH [Effusibacillus lacus]